MNALVRGIGIVLLAVTLVTGVSRSQEFPEEFHMEEGHEETDGGTAIHLVDVSFEVTGSLSPGSPVTISARVQVFEETFPVTLGLDLPEYTLVKEGYVDGQRELVEGTRIPPLFVDEAMVTPGADLIRSETITFDDPGLYTLEVTASVNVGDDPRWLSDNVLRASVKQAWILIAEDGTGRVLDEPEINILPEGHVKALGPLRSTAEGSAFRETPAVENAQLGTTTIRVRYRELGTEAWRYMGGVMVRSENAQGQQLEPNTDSNGYAEVYCGPGSVTSVLTHIRGKIKVFFRYSLTNKSGVAATIFDAPCGTTPVITAKRQMANAWVAMRKIETRLRTGFGQSRTPIDVVIYNEDRGGSYQYGFDERIKLGLNHFEDFTGFGTMAHEYGHAFHNEALGGYEKGGCPSPHFLDGAHGLRCALSEGFADFAAPLAAETILPSFYGVSPTQISWYWDVVWNRFYPASASNSTRPDLINDGSVIEGAVAAFFWDLYDGENTPEEGNESDFDRTEYPLSYIGDVMDSCLIKYPTSPVFWRKETGIDHLLTCFQEQKVSYANPYFARRLERGNSNDGSYTDFLVNATRPSGWSRNDIRILWKKTFYGIDPPPPPPPLSVSISGPSSCQTGQSCTWTANVSGGSGPISYHWDWRRSCLELPDSEGPSSAGFDPEPNDVPVCEWAGNGTNQTYSLTRSQAGPIQVRVRVTRGSETASRIKGVSIVNSASLTAADSTASTSVSLVGASMIAPPEELVLEPARPNPFSSDADIVFGLPEESHVRLVLYDLRGRKVANLVDQSLTGGWHTARVDASILSTGIYILHLLTNEEMRSMRITRIQ